MSITELAYVGLRSCDLASWSSVLRDVVGMQEVRDIRPGVNAYRLDDRDYRLFIEASERDGVDVIGWAVPSLAALDAMSERVAAAGAPVREASPELLQRRGARAIRCFKDAEGFDVEIAYAPPANTTPFAPGRPMSGFKTGDMGLGHVVLHCARYDENRKFYADVLGFRVSDYIVWADADATFMRCNRRHHSLALLNESLGMSGGALNHIQVEVTTLEDLGAAYDLALDRQLPIIMSLGQHSNDKMTSFYFAAPGGVAIEIGWNGVTVDDEAAWNVCTYDSTKVWGHRMD